MFASKNSPSYWGRAHPGTKASNMGKRLCQSSAGFKICINREVDSIWKFVLYKIQSLKLEFKVKLTFPQMSVPNYWHKYIQNIYWHKDLLTYISLLYLNFIQYIENKRKKGLKFYSIRDTQILLHFGVPWTTKFYSVLVSQTNNFYSIWVSLKTALVAQAWLGGYFLWAVFGDTKME